MVESENVSALPENSCICVLLTCEGPFVKVSVGLPKVRKNEILLGEAVAVSCKL